MRLVLWFACAVIALSGGSAFAADGSKTAPEVWASGDGLANGLLAIDLARPEPERIVKKIDILGRE